LGLDISTGGERLAGLDNKEVLGVNVVVLWEVAGVRVNIVLP